MLPEVLFKFPLKKEIRKCQSNRSGCPFLYWNTLGVLIYLINSWMIFLSQGVILSQLFPNPMSSSWAVLCPTECPYKSMARAVPVMRPWGEASGKQLGLLSGRAGGEGLTQTVFSLFVNTDVLKMPQCFLIRPRNCYIQGTDWVFHCEITERSFQGIPFVHLIHFVSS